jgi:KaiC/GvpD/RAD55 family RecA-like ATPase
MHVPSSQTASTLLLSLSQLCQERFSSNCPAIDSLLTPLHHPLSYHEHYYEEEEEEQSGLPRGGILELIGPPGIGKSRTVMAFALAQAFRLERRSKVLIVGALM